MTPAQKAAWEEKRGLEYGGAPSFVSVAHPETAGSGDDGVGSDCGCAEGGVSGAPPAK